MTQPAVYSLLLLFSMAPLLCASHICHPKGYYCPAGVDCSSNSSLCVEGVCEATTEESCLKEISVGFVNSLYDVDENNGLAQPVLELDGEIECCSVSVTVKVEDLTAKGGEDYEIPPNRYIKVKFPAGHPRASFDIKIINDDKLEGRETIRISIYELSVPYGIDLGSITSATITIMDDDSTTLSFSKSKFNVHEYEGQALPELALSVPAPFDFTVFIRSSNVDLSSECDNFESGSFEVNFPNGTTKVTFPINTTDDDVYEGDESFTLVIQDNLPNLVDLGTPYRATVIIKDDEKLIRAYFEESVYRVHEHDGSITPKLMLSEPSPCCFEVHTQLVNKTAHGRTIDFGYASPKIYNYTFHAGSTCAYPDANITITDDLIREDDETFEIAIMEAALPFNVEPGLPATIIINDNDNACFFKYNDYTVREDQEYIAIELKLKDPAASDRVIKVYSSRSGDTASADADYMSGPYDVRFRRGETSSYFRLYMKDDNIYEGDEYFTIYIGDPPHGIVLANPHTIKVTIEDDEYTVCFGEQRYRVDEGDRIQIDLTLSRSLPSPLTVYLEYTDMDAKVSTDYSSPKKSVRFDARKTKVSYTIYTRGDSILETKEKSFIITATYQSQPNNTDECDTSRVTIVDDDDCCVKCEKSVYYVDENSQLATVRLVLCDKPKFSFSMNIDEEDNTTIGGIDYTTQDYRTAARFEKDGSKYIELDIEPKDDDLVEADEVYYLTIEPATLPDRIVPCNPSKCKIVIRNDDESVVTRKDNVVKFSKAVDHPVVVTATYHNNGNPEIITLLPGDKEVTFDASRIRSLLRITITPDCRLERSDFKPNSSHRIYYKSPSC